MKARAKAERAAARQAASGHVTQQQTSTDAGPSIPIDGPSPESGAPDNGSQETEERRVAEAKKEALPDRTELLRSKPQAVGKFMQLIVPVLVDVYAASVYAPVRIKTLTAILKAISFLDADGLKRVFTVSFSLSYFQSGYLFLISLFLLLALLHLYYPQKTILHSSLARYSW